METRRVFRDELYDLVWTTPMNRLAATFGISGNGLAKICDRLSIPYPPRGYWAKLQAGKPVAKVKLQPRALGTPDFVEIRPTIKNDTPPEPALKPLSVRIENIAVPETLDGIHPKVKAWLSEHKHEQKVRADKIKQAGRERTFSWWEPLAELTERDLYRFRVTSAVFKGVEKAGGTVLEAPMTGKVAFGVSGKKIECSIVEKLFRPLVRPDGKVSWTAYPEHHQTGMQSSGFLRVSIKTWLPCKQPEWIETKDKKVADWLPDIVGAIMAAGPMLLEEDLRREEEQRRWQEKENQRRERIRLKEIDDQRWAKFRSKALDWEEHKRLLAFIGELQKQMETEGDVEVKDKPLSEWIAWAHERMDILDPFNQGASGLFRFLTL